MKNYKFRFWSCAEKEMKDWEWCLNHLELGDITSDYMQGFTGLHDKYNNKIWEDDVVEAHALLDSSKKFHCVVRWSEGGYIANGSLGVNCHQLEVIGNIHENPKLLKLCLK